MKYWLSQVVDDLLLLIDLVSQTAKLFAVRLTVWLHLLLQSPLRRRHQDRKRKARICDESRMEKERGGTRRRKQKENKITKQRACTFAHTHTHTPVHLWANGATWAWMQTATECIQVNTWKWKRRMLFTHMQNKHVHKHKQVIRTILFQLPSLFLSNSPGQL